MQSKLSRRGVIAGIAAAPVLPATQQSEADAALAALGEQFTAIVDLLGDENAWRKEALLSRLHDIGIAIMDTPATTIEGLLVKARITCFVQGGGIWLWSDPKHQPGYRWAMSIVADLVRPHDPGLLDDTPGAFGKAMRAPPRLRGPLLGGPWCFESPPART
jgi:hypothetical protein